jgi:XTP/dITP diphosphohydrolase
MEIGEVLFGLPLTIVTPDAVGITENPAETGKTFAENALEKAYFYYGRSNLPTLTDDSGIVVEAIKNELGLHTRRWGAGPDASDEEWIQFFINRMKREPNRKARFVCSLAHIDGDGLLHMFEGTCEGTITDDLEAEYLPGLPISACFKPEGFDKVFSALSVEQKNRISHRGKAVQQFSSYLRELLHKNENKEPRSSPDVIF